jgi:hypothetical protein
VFCSVTSAAVTLSGAAGCACSTSGNCN